MAEGNSPSDGLALDLRGLKDFVKGGIVSRTLVETSKMEIDLFLISKGQGLSEHTSTQDAVLYVSEGEGEVKLGEMSHLAGPGSLFYLPAGLPHSLKAKRDMAFLLTLVK